MAAIGIIGGSETNQIKSILERIYQNAGRELKLSLINAARQERQGRDGASPDTFPDTLPDDASKEYGVVIISDDEKLNERLEGISFPQDVFFIVNADCKNILSGIREIKKEANGRLITYGFSLKACATASGVTADDCKAVQYCLQRGIPTVSGGLVYEQEFRVKVGGEQRAFGSATDAVLAAVTAALVDDVEVGQLTGF